MKGFIKEKKTSVIDKSKFHPGCAYFVQWSASGGSWFTGILIDVDEECLQFTIWNGEVEYIGIDELMDPNNNYSITLLVPTDDDYLVSMVKRVNPKGYDRYINASRSYKK
jgi:hypothetical protein